MNFIYEIGYNHLGSKYIFEKMVDTLISRSMTLLFNIELQSFELDLANSY